MPFTYWVGAGVGFGFPLASVVPGVTSRNRTRLAVTSAPRLRFISGRTPVDRAGHRIGAGSQASHGWPRAGPVDPPIGSRGRPQSQTARLLAGDRRGGTRHAIGHPGGAREVIAMSIASTKLRSRRALLGAAMGAAAATVAGALRQPAEVHAGTDGDLVLGQTNLSDATTQLGVDDWMNSGTVLELRAGDGGTA